MSCETWSDTEEMLAHAEEVENAYGREVGIEIQNFARFLEEMGHD